MFFVVLLAVSMTHAAAGTMELEMTLADSSHMNMPDCDGCNGDSNGDMAACSMFCSVSAATLVGPNNPLPGDSVTSGIWPGIATFTGAVGPPESAPPRTLS